MTSQWKGDVPNLELLNRMVAAPLPLDLRSGPLETFFQRDIYVDSADWALRRRGVNCRLRIRVDDRRILMLRTVGRPEDRGALTEAQTFSADVPDLDIATALAGTSEPARRLRSLIDPALLTRRIEFETERRLRRTARRLFARGSYEVRYDVVTVRAAQRAATFQELTVRTLTSGRPGLEAVARGFSERYGLPTLLVDKVDRATKLLRELESGALAHSQSESREVAVIAVDGDGIAVLAEEQALTLPIRGGSGEEACREMLRTVFGSADGQLRFLGAAPGGASRPLLEVWLARNTTRARRRDDSHRVQWVPFGELLAGAGTANLRDPRTLAALTVAARTEMLTQQSAGAEGRREPERPAQRRLSDYARPSPLPAVATPSPEHFLNADLSLIEFNTRVLELAEDPAVPLLARIRFLSILSANLDEFFMVRVAALKRAAVDRRGEPNGDGLSVEEVLHAIAIRVRALCERQGRCWRDVCEPALAARGIVIRRWEDLTGPQQETLRGHFADKILPLMTPQALTRAPGHPFPLIPNLRLSLAVMVRDAAADRGGALHFVYLKVPESAPRFVSVAGGRDFVLVEAVIRANVGMLYPGRVVEGAHAFRVTRGADLAVDEQHATSLVQVIEEGTKRRPYGAAVRLEVSGDMPDSLRELALRELQFEDAAGDTPPGASDVYAAEGLIDQGALRELARLPLPDQDYPAHRGAAPLAGDRSIFEILAERDVLVHHPYDAFEATITRFLVEAADDPTVVAIKMTLYRVGADSAIVEGLLRAAARGTEVFVFVELKARFDEERNIAWARKLERGGIRVVHGLVELKTHTKTALVVRQGPDGIRRYVHIGTGNYNAATAALYTDVGLLSADPALGADVNDLFNELSGSSRPPQAAFRRILVSPLFLAPRLIELIEQEASNARAGGSARIRAKLNGLTDAEIITALYDASQAGVMIDLMVRGPCTLRPGVVGLSERIRVISVLGRFLEHSRIFHFASNAPAQYYIGSADWRPRNLRHRVEVVTPVTDPECCRRLDAILDSGFSDPTAWDLEPDGSYRRRQATPGADARGSQERLLEVR